MCTMVTALHHPETRQWCAARFTTAVWTITQAWATAPAQVQECEQHQELPTGTLQNPAAAQWFCANRAQEANLTSFVTFEFWKAYPAYGMGRFQTQHLFSEFILREK